MFVARHNLRAMIFTALDNCARNADPTLLMKVLSEVLCDQTLRSLGCRHEPNMRGVLELVLCNTPCRESNRSIDPIVLLPADARVQIRNPDRDEVCEWELRTLTLLGMWQATNPNEEKPSVDALQKLHKELMEDEEEGLLARPYSAWSPTLSAMETVLVSSFVASEPEIPLFLAVGGARVLICWRS